MNKFQVLICKMYLIIYKYNGNYKQFLMNKEDLINVRLFSLFIIKFAIVFIVPYKFYLVPYLTSSEKKIAIFIYLIFTSLLAIKIVKYSAKNNTNVNLDWREGKVRLVYYIWHIGVISLFLFLAQL